MKIKSILSSCIDSLGNMTQHEYQTDYDDYDGPSRPCQHLFNNQLYISIATTIVTTIIAFLAGCYGATDVRVALGVYLGVLNVSTALLFWYDKFCARQGRYRVPEVVLHYMTLYGAPVGALVGMYCPLCRHKTEKRTFVVTTFILVVLNVCWIFVYFIVTGRQSLSACYR